MENLSIDSLKNVLNGLEPEAKNAFDFLVSKKAPEKEQACALRAVEHLLLLDPDLPSIVATIVFQIPQIDQDDLNDIKTHFGKEVGGLVKDLMKFSRIKFQINTSEKRKTFIKRAVMILSKNNRSLYAKLATRLAKLEVRKSMTNATIEELARETLDVHAPLAELLGLWTLHQQLEDKAFEILQLQEYQKIALYKTNKLALNEDHINRIKQTVENVTKTAGINNIIEYKEKNLYEIYRKQKKKFNSNSLKDVMSFQIIVNDKRDCYRMLGLIHSLWKPQNQSFKDYISLPKINGYQALHTTVFGPNEHICLFQITAPEFLKRQQISMVKSQSEFNNKQAYDWLKTSTDETFSTDENLLIKGLKGNSMGKSILVFTNKGKILNLPKFSTCIDAAYHISSFTGNHYLQAYVNQNKVPYYYVLQTGDTVDIKTIQSAPGPQLDWINYVHSQKARSAIQNYLKKLDLEEQKSSGKHEIERLLKQLFSSTWRNQKKIIEKRVKDKFNLSTVDELFIQVGRGELKGKSVITKAFTEEELMLQTNSNKMHIAKINLKCVNQVGMLKSVTDKIVDVDTNIEKVVTKPDNAQQTSMVSILVTVNNFEKLYHMIQKIEHTNGILFVEREA